jgi:plasmid stabilization system protein ParE
VSGFEFHPSALTDLEEIWEFIATDSPDAADRVASEIHEAIGSLVALPKSGHIRPDLTRLPLRFHPVRSFLIAYAPDEKPLLVLGILHGRRNPRVIAAILRSRD